MSLSPLLLLSFLATVATQSDKDWNYGCQSLICDPPKICKIQDQVAQCLTDPNTTPNLFNGPVFTQPPSAQEAGFIEEQAPFRSPAGPASTDVPSFSTRINIPVGPDPAATTTTPSPFAPLLSLFGSPPPLTLPTLPPPPTTTTPAPVNICSLPPVTGNCSKARIMWYFDTETGKCERFSYSGCGNANRFSSRLHCEETCGGRKYRK